MDEEERRRLEARAPLIRLAQAGQRRREDGDHPRTPPWRLRRTMKQAFPVAEDRDHPVKPYPNMTNDLIISVELGTLAADDRALVKQAVWAVHPLFDTSGSGEHLWIDLPASKLDDPMAWIHEVISVVLPTVHAICPIRRVQYGRPVQVRTR